MGQMVPVELARTTVLGAESWKLSSRHVEAALTCTGGHLGPVSFKCGSRQIQPYSVAPWAEEQLDPSTPDVLRVLRGDFLCMPFGGNAKPHNGEQHPVHGEVANKPWELVSAQQSSSELVANFSLVTSIRPGKIEKQIRLVGAHT
jgi:D-hexose-6-phosphate mutarotase